MLLSVKITTQSTNPTPARQPHPTLEQSTPNTSIHSCNNAHSYLQLLHCVCRPHLMQYRPYCSWLSQSRRAANQKLPEASYEHEAAHKLGRQHPHNNTYFTRLHATPNVSPNTRL